MKRFNRITSRRLLAGGMSGLMALVAASPAAVEAAPATERLGTYVVKSVSSISLTRKGRQLGGPTDDCKPQPNGDGTFREPNAACYGRVQALRRGSELILLQSAPAGQLKSFLLEGKIIRPKCKHERAVEPGRDPFSTKMCRASSASALETGEREVFTFFRDTTDPQEDADMVSAWTGLFLMLPLGFGQATKVSLPRGQDHPALIQVVQQDYLSIGQVHKTYTLTRVGE